MKFLHTLQQKLGFTASETKVIIFLAIAFVAGTGIRWLKPAFPDDANAAQEFDYSAIDKEFFERSKKIPELTSAPPPSSASDSAGPAASAKSSSISPSAPAIINLNTATKQQLMSLPGIGESYADRIITYRDDNGPFESVEQLERIKGIGFKKLERLRPLLRVK